MHFLIIYIPISIIILAEAYFVQGCGKSSTICRGDYYCRQRIIHGLDLSMCVRYRAKGGFCDGRQIRCSPNLVCKERDGDIGGLTFCSEPSAIYIHPGGFNQGIYQTNGNAQNTALYGAFLNGALNQGNANQVRSSEDAQRAALYEAFIKGTLYQGSADQGLVPRKSASNGNFNQGTSMKDDDALRAALYGSFLKGVLNQGADNQGLSFGRGAPKGNSKKGTSPKDEDALRSELYESFLKGALNQGKGNQGLDLFRSAPNTGNQEKSPNKIISPNDEDTQSTALYEAIAGALSQGTNEKELQKAALKISFILGSLSNKGAPLNFKTQNQNDKARNVALYADFLNDLNQGYIVQAQRIKNRDTNETDYGIEEDLQLEPDQDNSFQSDVTSGKGNAALVTTGDEEEIFQVMSESGEENSTVEADVPVTVEEEASLMQEAL